MDNKNLLYFIVGTVVGGVSTYFLVKGKYENEYQKYREELRELYFSKSEKRESHEKEKEDIVNRINNLVTMHNDVDEYQSKAIDYASIQEDPYEEEMEVMQKASIFKDHPTEEDLPYIISEEEFADPIPSNDKVTLQYFIHDDILVDELSHEVLDVSSTITEQNLDELINGNDDCIYVRNIQKGTDYEITINQEPYEVYEKGYTEF